MGWPNLAFVSSDYPEAMNLLTAFAAIAVTAMLAFYALEARASWFVFAFAITCLASSIYRFLRGAWPFGVVEVIWCGVALRRWWGHYRPSANQ
jgi:hypothetical protein